MTRLLHISDLHFGRLHPPALAATVTMIATAKPDVVIISGDITQRARHHEYAAAAAFVDAIPCPVLAVPGNHDLPFHNVIERLAAPWRRFRRTLGASSAGTFKSDTVDILGLNTVQVLAIEDGAVQAETPTAIRSHFGARPPTMAAPLRMVVVHHPTVAPTDHPTQRCARGANELIDACDDVDVDLILSGHVHLPRVTPRPRPTGGHTLHIQCGTTTSNRFRGEDNGAVVIDVDDDGVSVALWTLVDGVFVCGRRERWRRTAVGLAPQL